MAGFESGARRLAVLRRTDDGQAPPFTGDDFGDDLVAAAAAGGGATVIADFSHVAGASGANGTSNISVGECVAVTHEHRGFQNLAA